MRKKIVFRRLCRLFAVCCCVYEIVLNLTLFAFVGPRYKIDSAPSKKKRRKIDRKNEGASDLQIQLACNVVAKGFFNCLPCYCSI